MPPKKATRQYATIETAAEMLACSTDTVRRMISRGEISGFKLPSTRLLRVDLDEINAMMVPIPTA